jgi:tetratricopeptide (TPR) repeat protein
VGLLQEPEASLTSAANRGAMVELRTEAYVLPAAEVGPENPLPVFRAPDRDWQVDPSAHNIPDEDLPGLGIATGRRILPHRMQDGYTRQRRPRALASLVLENEFLRVRVLPEVGGKVASIFHKPLQRELIYRNPVFQPGNLALRNAWTSGGIEWNVGQLGHHYLACSPVHCARVEGLNGEPVLRLYAWERVKCFPYQIDLHLPPGSPFLFARVRLTNPHDHELPMYWWTNIGMLEREGGRVLAPADTTYHGLAVHTCPVINGIDYSYSTRVRRSYDLFFRIPRDRRPWEAYLDREGQGFVHTSTWRLRGRKQFAWGMGQGGRRWAEYLAVPDMPHLEIQAGLATTQSHTVPMPAESEWTWTEAMGYFQVDPGKAHSENWQEAYAEAERELEELLPRSEVDRLDAAMAKVTTRMPDAVLSRGLGWGALEKRRAAGSGEDCGIPPELPFDNGDLGRDQEPWLQLLETDVLPQRDPRDDPGQFQIQDEWRTLLEGSMARGKSDHWLGWLHLGVMKLESGDSEGAKDAWENSLRRDANGWALRNLSVLEGRAGRREAAADLLAEAVKVGPLVPSLVGEYAGLLLTIKRFGTLDELLEGLPEHVRGAERLRMAAGWAALHYGRFEDVEELLTRDFATIQEGELTLSELWFALQERKLAVADGLEVDEVLRARVRREFPPPYHIDFRMSQEGDDAYIPPQAEAVPGPRAG